MIFLASSAKLDHLFRLTDNSGIRQRVGPSDPNAGYALDQNAEALVVAIRALALTRENGLLDYVRHYLTFVEQAQRPDGSFRSGMEMDGTWRPQAASQEAHGRAVWALGFAARQSKQTEVRVRALHCLDLALPTLGSLTSIQSQAAALLGVRHWREAEPSAALDRLADTLADSLAAAYGACASAEWRWFEEDLTPGSARLPEALLCTRFDGLALESLAWLCGLLEVNGCMSPIGTGGYRRGGERAEYDQLPAGAAALVSACVAAYKGAGNERFRDWALLGYEWFLGRNLTRQEMVDPETGGCRDALRAGGADEHQGAEALLAWLTAWETVAEQGWVGG